MLSVLIPTYNYNALPLVSEIHSQLTTAGIAFEIICLDDASKEMHVENEKINALPNARYEILTANIGRSKIRNLLSKKANFNWLLYLDVDVFPKDENFIPNYLPYLDNEVKTVNGGILYQQEKPEKSKVFRWVYGKEREALPYDVRSENPYLRFLTLNFLIHKSVFDRVTFNETIPNLRHEDTLFSYNLMEAQIPVYHIDNPVYHLGLDIFETAIRKENESLHALKNLTDKELLPADYLRISTAIAKIKKWKLSNIFVFLDRMFRNALLKNLSGNRPYLPFFDLYRLGYLCSIENKNKP
jgi:hypothetical protein